MNQSLIRKLNNKLIYKPFVLDYFIKVIFVWFVLSKK